MDQLPPEAQLEIPFLDAQCYMGSPEFIQVNLVGPNKHCYETQGANLVEQPNSSMLMLAFDVSSLCAGGIQLATPTMLLLVALLFMKLFTM